MSLRGSLSQVTAAATLLLPPLQLPLHPLWLTDTDVADASLLGGEIPIGLNGSSCFGTVSMQLRPQSVRGRKEREGWGGPEGGGRWPGGSKGFILEGVGALWCV